MKSTTAVENASAPATPAPPRNYLDFYGLAKPPFGEAAGGAGYMMFGSRQRAFDGLTDHVLNGHGVVVLEGDEGSGKTELLRSVAAVAGEAALQAVMVSRPANDRTSPRQLLTALQGGNLSGELNNHDAIAQFLAAPRKVLLVDDVDVMSDDSLRLILSVAQGIPDERGAPAIVLSTSSGMAGGPKSAEFAQLVDLARNTVRLSRLSAAEVRQYIERSLWIGGGTTRRLIAADAMRIIVARSGGLPGTTNRLMDAVLTAGFARGESLITARTVAAAVGPVAAKPARHPSATSVHLAMVLPIVSAGLLALGASLFLYEGLTSRSIVTPKLPVAPMSASPAAVPTTAPVPAAALPAEVISALMRRGDQSLGLGDIAAARLLYRRAAEAGNAAAAVAIGKTYDPNFVPPRQPSDAAVAAEWYRKALASGDSQAADLLRRLRGS